MTKEEKAKAYDEALERAKEIKSKILYSHLSTESCKAVSEYIDTIIPELAESEDERIRKIITDSVFYEYGAGVEYKDVLDYLDKLEKQKENFKSADSISSDCASDAKFEDRWHKVGDSLPDNGREVLAKDKLGNTLLARYDGEGWDVSVYDDEDYRCHNGISKWCEIPFEKQQEQKPAERSLEDDHIIGFVYDLLNEIEWKDSWAMSKDECLRLLKNYSPQKPADLPAGFYVTFPDGRKYYTKEMRCNGMNVKVVAPKPAEWSEEDEDIRQSIIKDIKWERANTPVTVDKDIRKYDKQIAWLKSLRPQPHWKPSEGEMKALQNAVALTACDKELTRLYNQLKKLM